MTNFIITTAITAYTSYAIQADSVDEAEKRWKRFAAQGINACYEDGYSDDETIIRVQEIK